MDAEKIASLLAKKTLAESNIDKAVRFALSYLEGLSIIETIDEVKIIELLYEKDKRFLNGSCKEIIPLKSSDFKNSGNIYVGRTLTNKVAEDKLTGILYIMGGKL